MSQQRSFARRTRVHRYSVLLAALVCGASLLTSVHVGANDADLDFLFNEGGIITTHLYELEQFNDIAIQPDGKIVGAGHTARFPFFGASERVFSIAVIRYTKDGFLDSTFGNGGIVTTDINQHATALGVALQADGKIVVAGSSGTANRPSFALVRYNTDGSLDPMFGEGGVVVTSIGSFSHIVDLALQSDGKIVVIGEGTARFAPAPTPMVARYNTDGCLDPTFDGDGISRTLSELPDSPPFSPKGVAIQSDDKIVVAGVCATGQLHRHIHPRG